MNDVDRISKIEAVDLRTGHITPRTNARTICYFIVENITERETIRKTAMALVLSGCREFHFYGKQEPLWHLIFDEVDIEINPNSTEENVALTMGYDTTDGFLEEVLGGASVRSFVPQQLVLFYDEETTYRKLIKEAVNYESSGRSNILLCIQAMYENRN